MHPIYLALLKEKHHQRLADTWCVCVFVLECRSSSISNISKKKKLGVKIENDNWYWRTHSLCASSFPHKPDMCMHNLKIKSLLYVSVGSTVILWLILVQFVLACFCLCLYMYLYLLNTYHTVVLWMLLFLILNLFICWASKPKQHCCETV